MCLWLSYITHIYRPEQGFKIWSISRIRAVRFSRGLRNWIRSKPVAYTNCVMNLEMTLMKYCQHSRSVQKLWSLEKESTQWTIAEPIVSRTVLHQRILGFARRVESVSDVKRHDWFHAHIAWIAFPERRDSRNTCCALVLRKIILSETSFCEVMSMQVRMTRRRTRRITLQQLPNVPRKVEARSGLGHIKTWFCNKELS